jgi:hypothetical protein
MLIAAEAGGADAIRSAAAMLRVATMIMKKLPESQAPSRKAASRRVCMV